MWWLEVATLAGFSVLLSAACLAWRRGGLRYGTRAGMTGMLLAGVVVLAVGVYLVVSTA